MGGLLIVLRRLRHDRQAPLSKNFRNQFTDSSNELTTALCSLFSGNIIAYSHISTAKHYVTHCNGGCNRKEYNL